MTWSLDKTENEIKARLETHTYRSYIHSYIGMGIPLYFKYLRTTYPHVVQALDIPHLRRRPDNSQQQQHHPSGQDAAAVVCDHLFLDFNCAVHRCAYDAVLAGHQSDDAVVEASCEFLRRIVDGTAPRSSVFVAVDGLPPFSKMAQQRCRRYMSEWKTSNAARNQKISVDDEKAEKHANEWDSNCVTPGTQFMTKLVEGLSRTAAHLRTSRGIDVVVSDSRVPGEGEQKITKRLRDMKTTGRDDGGENDTDNGGRQRVLVYGLDADLLLLTAICCRPGLDIRVLRPADGVDDAGSYFLVDVDAVCDVIHTKMKGPSRHVSVLEYTVICSLLGNDFIPGLACLPVSDDSFSTLTAAYHEVVKNHRGERRLIKYVGHDDVAIDTTILASILSAVAIFEDERMAATDRAYFSQVADQRRRSITDMEKYPLSHPFPNVIRPAEAGWRPRYYHFLFGGAVRRACADYLDGVRWSFAYHRGGLQRGKTYGADPTWHYIHHYAPTALDLSNHLLVTQGNVINRPTTPSSPEQATRLPVDWETLDPEFQLLMVLPPRSLGRFAPQYLSNLATDVSLGCVQFFPDAFRVITYLKRYTSECAPMLPTMDIEKLFGAYITTRPQAPVTKKKPRQVSKPRSCRPARHQESNDTNTGDPEPFLDIR